MSKNLPIENIAASKGMRIYAAGTHAVNCRAIVAKAGLVISAMTIGGAAATLTDYWPAGYNWSDGELFTFAELVTSITTTAGTFAVIKS